MRELKEKLTKEELELIKKLKLDKLDDLLDLEDELSDYLQLHCVTEKDNLNEEGLLCESILNKIGNIE